MNYDVKELLWLIKAAGGRARRDMPVLNAIRERFEGNPWPGLGSAPVCT